MKKSLPAVIEVLQKYIKNKDDVYELKQKITPFLQRRLKSDIAKDLPKKHIHSDIFIPFSNDQLELYNQIKKTKQKILPTLQKLRAICCIVKTEDEEDVFSRSLEEQKRKSPKIKWILDCLHTIKNKNEKVIIFTEYKDM